MHRFTHWLRQRACEGGLCLGLASGGLIALAQEAPETPAAPLSAQQLQKLLTDLDSDSFEVREAAAEKLAQAGPAAVDVLSSGLVSESAEIAWRSGAALERIALAGDEKTLSRVTGVLDTLSAKGKPGLKTMAAEMHIRQKHFRHDRAVASLKQNGAVFGGDGMELGGGPIIFGGPIAVAGPVMIEEIPLEVVPELEPAPAKLGDGIFGMLGRLFGGDAKPPVAPAPPIVVRERAVPAPADLIPALEIPEAVPEDAPKAEPAEIQRVAEPPALE